MISLLLKQNTRAIFFSMTPFLGHQTSDDSAPPIVKPPMISILLGVYNGENDLPQTLASIAHQTYTDWHVVAVDDGSCDRTYDVLAQFQKQFPQKTTLLKNDQNMGLTKSLIKAAAVATGSYLARLDAGDEFLPAKLEKQIDFLEHHQDYGIIGCNYINTFLPSGKEKKSRLPIDNNDIQKTLIKKNPFAHSCVLIRKKIYTKAGGYDETIRYGQDYELWFRILRLSKGANLSDHLCVRTIHTNHISLSLGYRKQRQQMWQGMKTQWKYMSKKNAKHYLYMLGLLSLILIPDMIKKYLKKK
ncbi:MAG TPA: hypothetical protein DCY48_03385 [Candidatus Magasanikbacteria bacterium]|nr:hypothetical protein [Candidatus Magasanikbacteria bacterium]